MINLRIPVLNITSIVLFFLLMASSLTTLAQEMQVVNMRGTIIEANNISHNVRYEVAFPKNLVGQLTEATNWGGEQFKF